MNGIIQMRLYTTIKSRSVQVIDFRAAGAERTDIQNNACASQDACRKSDPIPTSDRIVSYRGKLVVTHHSEF